MTKIVDTLVYGLGFLQIGFCRGSRPRDLTPQDSDASQRLRPIEVHIGSADAGNESPWLA